MDCSSAQCYDLGETRLHKPRGRFIEWWKNSDFRVDNSEYGDLFQFAALSGIIHKTGNGWEPFRATRKPFHLCEPGARKDGGYTCFMQPYFPPSPQATIRPADKDVETWTLSMEGIFRYERHYEGGFCFLPCSGTNDVVATLDLTTMAYDVSIKGHAVGVHRHLNKDGIELWRNQPFQARAELKARCLSRGSAEGFTALRRRQNRGGRDDGSSALRGQSQAEGWNCPGFV